MTKTTRRKFSLEKSFPADLTLTKAKVYIGRRALEGLPVGYAVGFTGIGHMVHFTIRRVK